MRTIVPGLLLVPLLLLPACRKERVPTPKEICEKGCAYRLACVDELELERAVTEANREHLRQRQAAARPGFLKPCVERCRKGVPRFKAFGDCGSMARDCPGYFDCESRALKGLLRPDAGAPARSDSGPRP
jgi:hypothetical protein